MTNYRALKDKEIATLTVYGCSAENWKNVRVSEDFSPDFISNVHFSGNNFLGTFSKVFQKEGGLKKHSGIFNSVLHNCIIDNDVYIDRINNYIANYHIEDGAYIENVNLLMVDGLSSFGNGVKVSVMIENGGREVSIFDNITAQFAYLDVFYRQHSKIYDRLENLISNYTKLQQSETGTIGKNSVIVNCGQLKNIRVGEYAKLEGVTLLDNGTIISNESAPAFVGAGVQCNDFIIQSGTMVTEAVLISRCFIGQGCSFGKQFSAVDSLFFANCQGQHGEAVSIFAGPFTVSHHKSTLMLTALFSFMNAGSGTNFSNHMYKLGPVHQGITERGVKMSSDSYLMWPAKIGAFTVVLGRHKGNPDISDLPFSYLLENNGESNLQPGVNLHSAGTMRDVQKWPKRDLRKDDKKLDLINFDFLSPFTVSKTLKGIRILKELLESMDETSSFVWYQNCKIKRSSIKKGIELYEMAVYKYVGNELIKKIKNKRLESKEDIVKLLYTNSGTGIGNWVDMAGLLTPKTEVEKLITRITNETISLEAIQKEFNELHRNYAEFSWNWAKDRLEIQLGKIIQEIEIQDVISVIEKWKEAELTFDDLILRDAKKEFNSISKTGFGMDGDEEQKNKDFEFVRGTYENNPFVIDVLNDIAIKTELGNELIASLSIIK